MYWNVAWSHSGRMHGMRSRCSGRTFTLKRMAGVWHSESRLWEKHAKVSFLSTCRPLP